MGLSRQIGRDTLQWKEQAVQRHGDSGSEVAEFQVARMLGACRERTLQSQCGQGTGSLTHQAKSGFSSVAAWSGGTARRPGFQWVTPAGSCVEAGLVTKTGA